MASFEEHILQTRKNLSFLSKINNECNEYWDWQVTTCFYIAVHLVNAHIAKKSNQHYRTHSEVKNALNPYVDLSLTKLEEKEYLAYSKLMNLSRRARYLCHDNTDNKSVDCHLTYDVHFRKSLKNLDILLNFFSKEYKLTFDILEIKCQELKNSELDFFEKV